MRVLCLGTEQYGENRCSQGCSGYIDKIVTDEDGRKEPVVILQDPDCPLGLLVPSLAIFFSFILLTLVKAVSDIEKKAEKKISTIIAAT